jgi:hypothetical protein
LVHAVAADGTLRLRHAPSGVAQRGVFPELCAPDPGDPRKLPKPSAWAHPCGACGRKRNLLADSACVACGKPKSFAFTATARRHVKRVQKLERLVAKPAKDLPPPQPPVARRDSRASGLARGGLGGGGGDGDSAHSRASAGSSSSSSGGRRPSTTLLSPLQGLAAAEPGAPLALLSPPDRLQPALPRRLSMRRGLSGSMRQSSMTRQSNSLGTLGEVAVEER